MNKIKDILPRLRVMLTPAAGVALSLLLLAVDYAWRWLKRSYRWLIDVLPSVARLFAIGGLIGGIFVGGLFMAQRSAILVPSTDWSRVAFVWGLALLIWAIAAIAFIVTKVSASLLSSVVYRLTDIASRPVHVVDESPRIRPGIAQPTFRDPGKLKDSDRPGTGEFVGYSDEVAYVQTLAEDLKAAGMNDAQITEVLDEYRKTNPG